MSKLSLPFTFFLQFLASMANMMSIDASPVSKSEKICNFHAGLRVHMQKKHAYDLE
jgi:hypothetical protein